MLVLSKALQKAGESAFIRFSRVSYSQSGAISALLTEKADAVELLKTRKNTLIRAAKMIDTAVIGAEALQCLKVHGMPLERYLGEGKMELLKREVESSTGVQLKIPRWLILESRLRERQESGNNRGSAIVITVANNSEATHLCAKGLRFDCNWWKGIGKLDRDQYALFVVVLAMIVWVNLDQDQYNVRYVQGLIS